MSARVPRRWIVVLTKEPRPGSVKTRLGKAIGMPEAAALAMCLLEDSLSVAVRAADEAGAGLVVAHAPDELSSGSTTKAAPLPGTHLFFFK